MDRQPAGRRLPACDVSAGGRIWHGDGVQACPGRRGQCARTGAGNGSSSSSRCRSATRQRIVAAGPSLRASSLPAALHPLPASLAGGSLLLAGAGGTGMRCELSTGGARTRSLRAPADVIIVELKQYRWWLRCAAAGRLRPRAADATSTSGGVSSAWSTGRRPGKPSCSRRGGGDWTFGCGGT